MINDKISIRAIIPRDGHLAALLGATCVRYPGTLHDFSHVATQVVFAPWHADCVGTLALECQYVVRLLLLPC